MNIEQTCKVILTAGEVKAALTEYIREKCRYRAKFKPYDECLSFTATDLEGRTEEPISIVVLWGEPPEEPVEEPIVAPPITALTPAAP